MSRLKDIVKRNAFAMRLFRRAQHVRGQMDLFVKLRSGDASAWSSYLNQPATIARRYESFRRRQRVSGGFRSSVPVEDIEIVISSYNHGRFLPRTLKGITAQTVRRKICVTLVDNGSSDDTRSMLARRPADERLDLNLVLLDQNVGMADGFNRGIEAARKDLVCLLCADDCLVPNFLEEATRSFSLHPDIALLGGGSVWFETDEQLEALIARYGNDPFSSSVHRCVPADHDVTRGSNSVNMSLSSLTFFKSVWNAVGRLEPNKKKRITEYDDRDFELKVCSSYPVGISQEPFVYYRVGSSNWSA